MKELVKKEYAHNNILCLYNDKNKLGFISDAKPCLSDISFYYYCNAI